MPERPRIPPKETLADILVRRFEIPSKVLDQAVQAAEATGARLEVVLARQQSVNEAQLALATAEYLKLPPVSLAHFNPDGDVVASVPSQVLTSLRILPIARWGDELGVAMADPFDVGALEDLQRLVPDTVRVYVAPPTQVLDLLARCDRSGTQALREVLRGVPSAWTDIELARQEEEKQKESVSEGGDQAPIVRVVHSILIEALQARASDIHIEPLEEAIRVRYRIDGVLYDQASPPYYMFWAMISRIKIIAKLDIGERRLPQDGRFSISSAGRKADVRVSLVPTVHGQKAVLRILDPGNLKPNLAALELAAEDYERLSRAIRQPSGLILVTGPTGSGKTTTLYSALQELNDPAVNIITVEDPVEYRLPRINQIPVNPAIGLTFAEGLRSILRQDPNIIMVGEIRDKETAQIAVQASLTGHLVLTTLHTNDAAGAVARMVDMGVEPFLLSSSLILAQAQRIYRRLCAHCKTVQPLTPEAMARHGVDASAFDGVTVYGPAGCQLCNHIGYAGRDAIMEILPIDEDLREEILHDVSASRIRKLAAARGMLSLRDAGLGRVKSGVTSFEEILRVTATL